MTEWDHMDVPIPYPHKISPRHFFEVWRHYLNVLRSIFERSLWSGEGKSYVGTIKESLGTIDKKLQLMEKGKWFALGGVH